MRHVAPPLVLRDLIPIGDHETLADLEAKWRRRGVPLAEVADHLRHVARVRAGVEQLKPMRGRQARAARVLRRRLLTILREVKRAYDRDPVRAAVVRSPIQRHVAALLAYFTEAGAISRGRRTYGPQVRVDFADPLVPPIAARRGPALTFDDVRKDLHALLRSHRDVRWLMSRATVPPR